MRSDLKGPDDPRLVAARARDAIVGLSVMILSALGVITILILWLIAMYRLITWGF